MDLCPGYHSLIGARLGLCCACERRTDGKATLTPPATYDGKTWTCAERVYGGDGYPARHDSNIVARTQ